MEVRSVENTLERSILTTFQINKETGFTEDFKTTCMQALFSYFSEEDIAFAKMCLWWKTLEDICNKFSSYRDYIENLVDKLWKQVPFWEREVDKSLVIQTLLDILNPHNEHDFDKDFNNIKDEILIYDSSREKIFDSRERIFDLLSVFKKKYFPQPQDNTSSNCLEFEQQDFKRKVLERIKQILEN